MRSVGRDRAALVFGAAVLLCAAAALPARAGQEQILQRLRARVGGVSTLTARLVQEKRIPLLGGKIEKQQGRLLWKSPHRFLLRLDGPAASTTMIDEHALTLRYDAFSRTEKRLLRDDAGARFFAQQIWAVMAGDFTALAGRYEVSAEQTAARVQVRLKRRSATAHGPQTIVVGFSAAGGLEDVLITAAEGSWTRWRLSQVRVNPTIEEAAFTLPRQ